MKIAFVSNYINHHQIPFCNEMYRLTGGQFTFVQTEVMEPERVRMGWHEEMRPAYVRCWYEEEDFCRALLMDCDTVLFGGVDDESFLQERLASGKLIIRLSERLYKAGQWKAISPRGLRKKYNDHTRYRNSAVYLLCYGAYVPSDFHIVRAYPGKMYCWGYFPEIKQYETDVLLAGKGFGRQGGIPRLLWAARMIGWKHPELAIETARYLKEKGIVFHMDLIGDGERRGNMEALRSRYGLESCVQFLGFQAPERVREYMEKADIFLFTSDRREGWGAVANEAMNSGCALVAGHMIGAVPYLVKQGENGFVYRDGRPEELFSMAARLASDRELCRAIGENAYRTIADVWNAPNAAARLMELIGKLTGDGGTAEGGDTTGGRSIAKYANTAEHIRTLERNSAVGGCFQGGLMPCAPAPVMSERGALRLLRKGNPFRN